MPRIECHEYLGELRVTYSFDDIADECRAKSVGVVEFSDHGGGQDAFTVHSGAGGKITKENAAEFARMLKDRVFHGQTGGLIIISACLVGTYTTADNDDDPETKSLAQIIADESGAYVLSTGGFSHGTFADYFEACKENRTSSKPRSTRCYGSTLPSRGWESHFTGRRVTGNGKATMYESMDDVWYFTYPNRDSASRASGSYLSAVFEYILGNLDDSEGQE
jgi:hypothetical protein